MCDQSADGHARERIEEREDGIEDSAADVFEVDVDAFRAGGLECRGEITAAVIDAGVETKLFDDIVGTSFHRQQFRRHGSP